MAFTNTGFERREWEIEIRKSRSSPTERGLDSGLKMNGEKKSDYKMKICVIGSGDFGRALAGRLASMKYNVIIASRNPDKNR